MSEEMVPKAKILAVLNQLLSQYSARTSLLGPDDEDYGMGSTFRCLIWDLHSAIFGDEPLHVAARLAAINGPLRIEDRRTVTDFTKPEGSAER